MSLLGHVAVGVATARAITPTGSPAGLLEKRMLALGALSLLPDIDFLFPTHGDSIGEYTHRGATHSLVFALLVGIVIAVAIRAAGSRDALLWGALATAMVAGHGLLDMFGQTTLGVDLFWPFSDARLLAPWHVLPNPPWPGLFSDFGLREVALEVVVFIPLWLYAFVPRRWFGAPAET